MLARISTVAFEGTNTLDIDVQVQMSSGVVCFALVGLPDKAVAESRERVRAALFALGLALPAKHIPVNHAPADVLKEGSHFDLPIALALVAGMGVLPQEEIANYTALGELALDGAIAPVAGVLPAAVTASAHGRGLICPAKNGGEAAFAADGELDRYMHLFALNRGILLTPFHNMALFSPAHTAQDVDLHTKVFAESVERLLKS